MTLQRILRLRSGILATLLVMALAGMARAQTNAVTFLANWDERPGYSALYGYTAPDGREYAVLGAVDGTVVIEITDAPTLRFVGYIPGPGSSWREVKTYSHYAYVVSEGGGGVHIIDLSTLPDSVSLVKSFTYETATRSHTVSVGDGYLLLNGSNYKSGGIILFDLADPVNPAFVGEYQGHYVHDCFMRNDTIYAAAIYNGGGLIVINAANTSSLQVLAHVQYPGSGTHNAEPTADGSFVMTTDEIGSTLKTLKVWDIRDLNNVSMVAEYSHNVQRTIHNVHPDGDFAHVAWYADGYTVLDIVDPASPVQVGFHDTPDGSLMWDVYGNFPSGKVIGSNTSAGLFVWQFTPVYAGRLRGVVLDAGTHLPVVEASVRVLGTSIVLRTDLEGKFTTGGPAGAFNVLVEKHGVTLSYMSDTLNATLLSGSVLTDTVYLQQLPSGVVSGTVAHPVSGAPLSAVPVGIMGTTVVTTTDVAGHYELPPLRSDTSFSVGVAAFGYTRAVENVTPLAGQTVQLDLAVEQRVVEDFEYPTGWTVGAAGDNATVGHWERGDPNPTKYPPFGNSVQYQPDSNHTPGGVSAFCTGLSNSLTDNPDGRTTLTSPMFDLTGVADPHLTYWRWFTTSATTASDYFRSEISNNNGDSWVPMELATTSQSAWVERTYRIADVVPPTASMRIRFMVHDVDDATITEGLVDDIEVTSGVTSVGGGTVVPTGFRLAQNYPNPFNPGSVIMFDLPLSSEVRLAVYNLFGQEVMVLVEGTCEAGSHTVTVDGSRLASGVYFYTLKTPAFSATRTMMLIK